jgi:RES domain-containing protein
MRIWRSSAHSDLSGEGGLYASGRWHTQGRRIVYLSDHPASVLAEVLVHLEVDAEDLPDTYQLLGVDVADDVSFETIELTQLAATWRDNHAVTRHSGDQWLSGGRTALLRVPSAIVPFAWNWLLNPAHQDAAQARITEIIQAPFDPRLLTRA